MKSKTPKSAPSGPEAAPEAETSPPESLGEQLLELILEAEEKRADAPEERRDGVWVGRLERFTAAEGSPLVTFEGCAPAEGLVARTTAKLELDNVGQDVALMFENGDPSRPIVVGLMRHSPSSSVHVEVDGERTVVSAEREIVLRCGEASITLTRAGKVLIRGEYVLTRSAGVNRIQGGSVQIN